MNLISISNHNRVTLSLDIEKKIEKEIYRSSYLFICAEFCINLYSYLDVFTP